MSKEPEKTTTCSDGERSGGRKGCGSEKIIHSGYITKRPLSGTIGSSWRRRFFTLHHDVISYYVSDKAVHLKPCGILMLTAEASLELYNNDRLAFRLESANRTLVARCPSRKDLVIWMRCIRSAIAIQRCTTGPFSRAVFRNGVLNKKSIGGSGYSQRRWFELVGRKLYYFKLKGNVPHELCRAMTIGPNTTVLSRWDMDKREEGQRDSDLLNDLTITLRFENGTQLEMDAGTTSNRAEWRIAFEKSIIFSKYLERESNSSLIVSCRNFSIPDVHLSRSAMSTGSDNMTRAAFTATKSCPKDMTIASSQVIPRRFVSHAPRLSPSDASIRQMRTTSIKLVELLPHRSQHRTNKQLTCGGITANPRDADARSHTPPRILPPSRRRSLARFIAEDAAKQARQASQRAIAFANEAFASLHSADMWDMILGRWLAYAPQCCEHLAWCVRRGIAHRRRFEVWRKFLAAENAQMRYQSLFRELHSIPVAHGSTTSILNDLDRTSESPLFRGERRGQKILYHVLKCIALHDPELGYCQGMNWIASAFIEVACSVSDSHFSSSTFQSGRLLATPTAIASSRRVPILVQRNRHHDEIQEDDDSKTSPIRRVPECKGRSLSPSVALGHFRGRSSKTPIVHQGWLWQIHRRNADSATSMFSFANPFQSSEDKYWVILQREKMSWFVRKRVSVTRVGEAQGSVLISHHCSVRTTKGGHGGNQFSFELHLPSDARVRGGPRVLVFRALSEDLRSKWIRAISSVIRDAQPQGLLSPEFVMVAAREAVRQMVLSSRSDTNEEISFETLQNRLVRTVGKRAYECARARIVSEFSDMVDRARISKRRSRGVGRSIDKSATKVRERSIENDESSRSEESKIKQLGMLEGADYCRAEKVFWMLVSVLEHPSFGLRKLFATGFAQLDFCLFAFEELFRDRNRVACEALCTKKDEVGIPIEPTCRLYAMQWFMTFFARDFPLELSLRVWDLFLLEGWPILFQVALAVMELAEQMILESDFEDSLQYIQRSLPMSINAEALMERACAISVSETELASIRLRYERSKRLVE